MMDKFKYIQESPDSDGIRNSLILTLSDMEACRFLEMELVGDFLLRRYLIRKIVSDLQKSYRPCHKQLVEKLISSLDDKAIRDRAAYPLSELCSYLPQKFRAKIVSKFLGSKYKGLRNRGYKQLLSEWDGTHKSQVRENWGHYQDFYAARVLIENCSARELNLYKASLIENLPSWLISRLYIKVAKTNLGVLEELKTIDQISYAYVTVKLGNKIPGKEGESLLAANYKDDRVGLLLWCFGHSGLWNLITEYKEKYAQSSIPSKVADNE